MYKCASLVAAEAVVDRAMQAINSEEGLGAPCYGLPDTFRVCVEAYQNGREQGFLLWPMFAAELAYYVCERRGSDGVCVYRGAYAMKSISEDAYQHPHYFADTNAAVEWLIPDLVALFHEQQARANIRAEKKPQSQPLA